MNQKLSTFKLQLLILLFGFLAVSCTNDDEANTKPASSGNIEFDGTKYSMKNGFFQDNGPVNIYGEDETHYNYNFFLTDGIPSFDNTGKIKNIENGKIVMFTSLISPGKTEFKTGTFGYASFMDDMDLEEEELEEKYKNKSFFPMAFVILDTDNDKNWEEEDEIEVSGGTIKISGTAPKYTTEYNLNLKNGKTLKGGYTGTYTKIDE
jgi:hypothetical protein